MPAGMVTDSFFCRRTLPAPPQDLQGWWMIFPVPRQRVQAAVVEKEKPPPPRWIRTTPLP